MTLEVGAQGHEELAPPPPLVDQMELEDGGAPDDEPQVEAPKPRPRPRPRAANGTNGQLARAERIQTETEAEELSDWLGSLAAESAIRVTIFRLKPQLGPNGENIGGSLETAEEMIDEGYIRETWGGGTFQLKVSRPDASGKWKWFKTKTIKIAGAPRMGGTELGGHVATVQPVANGRDSLSERAFNMATDLAREERERADRISREAGARGGLDIGAMQTLMQPLQDQVLAAQSTIRDLQAQLLAAISKPPPTDTFRDTILQRAVEGESSRLEALRAQYEVRIDKMRDYHEDELKRLRQQHADDVKRIEDRHERELRHRDKTDDQASKSADQAHQARIDSLKETIARLERELTAATAKVATLEAKKDQTIADKADELLKVKEALDGIGGGAEEAEEKWYEKVIATVGQLPAVSGALEKLAGSPPSQQQPQRPMMQQMPQQLPPPGIPFRAPDGQVYVHDGHGNFGIVNQAALQRQQAIAAARAQRRRPQQPGQPQAANEQQVEEPIGKPPAAKDVKLAVTFMENAVRANADPEAFARTARSMVPGEVLVFAQRVGIDELLSKVIDANSPLATTRGRQWARKVFAILVGDDGSGGAEAPPAEAGDDDAVEPGEETAG